MHNISGVFLPLSASAHLLLITLRPTRVSPVTDRPVAETSLPCGVLVVRSTPRALARDAPKPLRAPLGLASAVAGVVESPATPPK